MFIIFRRGENGNRNGLDGLNKTLASRWFTTKQSERLNIPLPGIHSAAPPINISLTTIIYPPRRRPSGASGVSHVFLARIASCMHIQDVSQFLYFLTYISSSIDLIWFWVKIQSNVIFFVILWHIVLENIFILMLKWFRLNTSYRQVEIRRKVCHFKRDSCKLSWMFF